MSSNLPEHRLIRVYLELASYKGMNYNAIPFRLPRPVKIFRELGRPSDSSQMRSGDGTKDRLCSSSAWRGLKGHPLPIWSWLPSVGMRSHLLEPPHDAPANMMILTPLKPSKPRLCTSLLLRGRFGPSCALKLKVRGGQYCINPPSPAYVTCHTVSTPRDVRRACLWPK